MRLLSTRSTFRPLWHVVVAALLLTNAALAHAQTDTDAGDPPSQVARISYVDSNVGLMPSGSSDWIDATVNRPVTIGDKLSSAQEARAELELGGGVLRMAGQTDIGVLNLTNQITQVELNQGTLNLNVRILAQGETYEIDTPTLALVVDQPGIFRVDVGSDGGSTTVTAFAGGATVYGENNVQQPLYAGRSYVFNDSSLSNAMVSDIQGGDAFDAWCSDRDSQYGAVSSSQYVSDDVVGAQDLNNYGDWQADPDYGDIWYPTGVAVGWAPYRFGHWAWIGPWGWTWIDNLPWGFAPYHYGRWAYVHGNWGWIPGPRGARAVYAPALVAFAGGIGAGGPVGWFPLGPGEVYNPWYRVSRGYYTNVNVTNIGGSVGRANVIGTVNSHYSYYASGRAAPGATYVNRNAPRAFSAVSAQSFASARDVQSSMVRMTPQQVAAAPVVGAAALQRPTAASFGQASQVSSRQLPAAGFNRAVVARSAPAATLPANTVLRGGQPAGSNVRVLNNAAAAARFGTSRVAPHQADNVVPSGRPATLPPIPHFERAAQLQPVQQNAPEQDHMEPAERSHSFVPQEREQTQQRYEPAPQPAIYQQQPYQRPVPQQGQQQQRQEPAKTHQQSAPARPRYEDNGR